MIEMDFLTIFIATIVSFIISLFWFSSFFFKKTWKNYRDFTIRKKYFHLPIFFALHWLVAFFIAFIEIYFGATSFWDGIITGAVLWLGFVMPTQIFSLYFKKHAFKLFFDENALFFINFLVPGCILAG